MAEELTLEERNAKIRAQLAVWRDSFIDVRIKNNMLHQPPAETDAIKLDVTETFPYERFWEMAAGKGNAEEYALKTHGVIVPGFKPIAWKTERSGVLDVAALENLVSRSYKSIIQKGENPLCLTFGKLRWRVLETEKNKNQEENQESEQNKYCWIESPIVFMPIKVNQVASTFWLKPVDDDAFINPALTIRYKKETGKEFPLPRLGQWPDKDSFDIVKYFEELADIFCTQDFSFTPDYVALDVFDSERICMYRDVVRHFDELQNHKIIRAFFGESLGEPIGVVGLDNINPYENYSVLDTNSSQNDVIERFKAGESFILEGPPGTGKTQTIINMITEAIADNKKVLFVSGKMSALNTVKKKLQMTGVNLDKHCLLIKSEAETKDVNLTDVYGSLKAAYEAPAPVYNDAEFGEWCETYTETRDVILGYNEEFYNNDNSLGWSIYDIIGQMLLLGYNENHVVRVDFDYSFISSLTKPILREYSDKINLVENLLSRILSRSETVENDVWYGFRNYELDANTESQLRSFCATFGANLREIENVFRSVRGMEAYGADKVVEELERYPLQSVAFAMDEKYLADLGELYLNGSFATAKKALEKEIAYAAEYAGVARVYYRDTLGDSTADPDGLATKLKGASNYSKLLLTTVKEELKKVEYIAQNVQLHFDTDVSEDLSAKQIAELIKNIQDYLFALETRDGLKAEISQNFTDELFALDYKRLLVKFRTSWEKSLKEEKSPFLFGLQIKSVKKYCKNAVGTDFSPRAVYGLLEKLDEYHTLALRVASLKITLDKCGISGVTHSADALKNLLGVLGDYQKEKESHAVNNLLFQRLTFEEYIARKAQVLKDVLSVVQDLRVKADMTVEELSALVETYRKVKATNERIAANDAWKDLFPSVQKDARTPWKELLALLGLVEKAREILRKDNRTIQEDYETFKNIIEVMIGKELNVRIQSVIDAYRAFYANERWFDKEIDEKSHTGEDFTYGQFVAWMEQISDINHVAEYVNYRKAVRDLDGYGRQFFDIYAGLGRKEYPIDKMCENYKISMLYAYYVYLLRRSEYVAKMSGSDGVTCVEDVMNRFAEADEKLLEYNRRRVDLLARCQIGRIASSRENIHGYLNSIPTGKKASARRLFKTRSESIKELAPCIMMSVYSVSKLLEYEQYRFDVVIFDEASQIPAEDALTSIMRATEQVIIAGDPKQMPAISYFQQNLRNKDTTNDEDATCASIIDFLIRSQYKKIGYDRLDMHYRSNHESLIKYSNEKPELYGGNLVTFPSPKARTKDFGLWNYPTYEDERFKGQTIVGGGGKNEAEAQIVVDLIREHFEKYPLPKTEEEKETYNSLGVIVFGAPQKKLILDKLAEDNKLAKLCALNDTRVFMIVTADEVQGDEMSEMIISLTYGRDESGNVTKTWGHLNQMPVALYKFNVAVTRARNNLKFVHTITAGDVINEKNLGYVGQYLAQFERFSKEAFEDHKEYNTAFITAVGQICESIVGKERVVYNYGESPRSYRVPISILSQDGQSVVLGVMCERNRGKLKDGELLGAQNGQGFSVREYGRTCKQILKAHDWNNLYETYAMQWIRNYAYEKKNLIAALNAVK